MHMIFHVSGLVTSLLSYMYMYMYLCDLIHVEYQLYKMEIAVSNPTQGSLAFFFEISCLPWVTPFALSISTVLAFMIRIHKKA